jgi:hypothetical protein
MAYASVSSPHLLANDFTGVHDMRAFYAAAGMIPTSENADIALIRSHVAYWAGRRAAELIDVRASRGHSYRFDLHGERHVVEIVDHYDHRAGVIGFCRPEGGAV